MLVKITIITTITKPPNHIIHVEEHLENLQNRSKILMNDPHTEEHLQLQNRSKLLIRSAANLKLSLLTIIMVITHPHYGAAK